MKNTVLVSLFYLFLLSGCTIFRSPHKDFRSVGLVNTTQVSFLYGRDNRFAVYLPGIMSEERLVSLDCDCASGNISFHDYLRWPHSLYEIKWDTVNIKTPCYCDLFYLQHHPILGKDIQRKVHFSWGFTVVKEEDYFE